MKMACLLEVSLLLWSMLLMSVVPRELLFPAMFVFGDSLIDSGNNNDLKSLAKANYVPYGIDFPGGARPTGRFSNGQTFIDFLGEMLGLPYLPPFADTTEQSTNISRGVNYASAAAGILDETGQFLGERITFSQQVENFETTLGQLKTQMEDKKLSHYLAHSLTVVNHGNNDYVNNYLLPEYGTSFHYDPKNYADLLIELYKKQILALRGLGLKKFLLAGVGPLGCIPNQLSKGFAPPGECRRYVNDIVAMFNVLLRSLVDQLNKEYRDSIFVYGNTFEGLYEIIKDHNSYGLSVNDRACCGIGWNGGHKSCLPLSYPCTNRDQYVFWDAFHPTQAVSKIIARRAFAGPPSDCYPINVKQMAGMPQHRL